MHNIYIHTYFNIFIHLYIFSAIKKTKKINISWLWQKKKRKKPKKPEKPKNKNKRKKIFQDSSEKPRENQKNNKIKKRIFQDSWKRKNTKIQKFPRNSNKPIKKKNIPGLLEKEKNAKKKKFEKTKQTNKKIIIFQDYWKK